jgi:serine O-acetyltransferase
MLYTDPAFENPLEAFYAYPGIWALWYYRLSHVLWERELPYLSRFVPRLVMALVRYVTSVDIHPAAKISEGGIMLDHACGVVIGATAEVGARTIFYHQVTLGSSGKSPPPDGHRRHPIVGDDCVLGTDMCVRGGGCVCVCGCRWWNLKEEEGWIDRCLL